MGEETVSDLTKVLKEGQDEGTEEELEVEEPDLEEEGLEDEGTDKENEEEDEEGKEGKEGKETKGIEIPQYKEVAKKYPNFFKDFPNFRHIIFHEREYKELFPTIEEAKEAAEDLQGLQELQDALSSGKPEDTANVLASIKGLGDDALPSLAINFLSTIKKMDQDLYYQVITPEIVNMTRVMFDAGLRNENDNLKNAAMVAALHFFGDTKVASGEKEVKLPGPKKETVVDDKLEKERQTFRTERYTSFYNDVVQVSDSNLSKAILNGIDPKEEMTEGIKELVSEKVMKEVAKTLAANSSHTAKMDSLWRKAAKENFPANWKSKIISAYLESAKEIMPRIRSKVRANILGIRDRHSDNNDGGTKVRKRIEPDLTSGGGRRSTTSDFKNLNAKDIDWRKSSDLDIIRGNVTLKKS